MNILAKIGLADTSLQYKDRPTVKIVIKKDNNLLILNKGLLPGGGIDPGESDEDAITRELQEELGVTVQNIQEIGTVVQYRNLLDKKYLINGYTAELDTTGGLIDPQDEGEAQFTLQWLTLDEAMAYVSESIEEAKLKPMDDDANQGKLYNLMATYELLNHLIQ
jgi:8-oxo-dGTP diphosphatase